MAERRRRRAAFTLVELLVVIGIIAVLIGILLPALSRARESGNLIKCQANLKQIGTALHIYAGQNRGMLPYGFFDRDTPVPGMGPPPYRAESGDWTTLLVTALTTRGGVGYTQQTGQTQGDTAAAFAGPRKVFLCPSVTTDPSGQRAVTLTHYSVHPRLMPNIHDRDNSVTSVPPAQRPGMRPYPLAKVKRAAEIVAVFDGTLSPKPAMNFTTFVVAFALDNSRFNLGPPQTNLSTYMTDNYAGSTIDAGQPVDMTPFKVAGDPNRVYNADVDDDIGASNAGNIRFRHMKDTQANFLMIDGHVESFRYKKSDRTTDLLRRNINVNPLR